MPSFDPAVLVPYLPEFLRGTWTTIWISSLAIAVALVLGLLVALARLARNRVVSAIARGYIDLIRGTPALIQIFFIYFGMPALGLNLEAWFAGILGLGINSSAYVAEIVRSGIQSVDRGQVEAARSLGMSRAAAMRRIVLPQALPMSIPPLTGEATNLIKGSSLLSVISISELTRVGSQIIGVTFRPIEAYLGVALIYLALNTALAQAALMLERRLRVTARR